MQYFRYIYVDEKANQVHLAVPISGGSEIGTDNTCQSVVAMQCFFGMAHQQKQEGIPSAFKELQAYRDKLILETRQEKNKKIRSKKIDQIKQIKKYMAALEAMLKHREIKQLRNIFPSYPTSIKELMEERENLFSVCLRPPKLDKQIKGSSYIFSLNRKNLNGFYGVLEKNLIEPIVDKEIAIKALLKKKIDLEEKITNEKDLDELKRQLTIVIEDFYHEKADFTKSSRAEIANIEYFKNICLWDEKQTASQCIGDLINACSPNLLDRKLTFEDANKERLNILIQLFLAEINIYCYTNHINKVDFGEILDRDKSLSRRLVKIVNKAIRDHANVGEAILRFVSENREFKVNRKLRSADRKKIKEQFSIHYQTIKDAPHFDEFVILDKMKPGKFFAHKGAICVDFTELTAKIPNVDNQFFEEVRSASRTARKVKLKKSELHNKHNKKSEKKIQVEVSEKPVIPAKKTVTKSTAHSP